MGFTESAAVSSSGGRCLVGLVAGPVVLIVLIEDDCRQVCKNAAPCGRPRAHPWGGQAVFGAALGWYFGSQSKDTKG